MVAWADGVAWRPSLRPFIFYFIKSTPNIYENWMNHVSFDSERQGRGWQPIGVAYYPLWRARRAAGAVETRGGPWGDLEVKLDGRRERMELAHGPGAPELAGVGVSVATAILWLVSALALPGRRPGRAHRS